MLSIFSGKWGMYFIMSKSYFRYGPDGTEDKISLIKNQYINHKPGIHI